MPRRYVEKLDATAAYASGSSVPLNLAPKPYVITSLLFDLIFNLTTAGAPTYTQDPYFRLINSLSLVGDKARQYIGIQDPRPLHFENKIFLPHAYTPMTPPAGSITGGVYRAQLRVHFGSRPISPDGTYNPYDLTAGIPTDQSQLNLTFGFGASSTMSATSGYTINAGTKVQVTCFGVQPKAGEAPIVPAAYPMLVTNGFVPSATTASLGTSYPVPTTHFWHSSTILSLYGTAPADNRSDSALADIGVKTPADGNAQLAKWEWTSFAQDTGSRRSVQDDDGTTFGTPVVNVGWDAGVGRIDMTTIGGNVNPLYGLDMRLMNPGDVVMNMGVSSIGNVYMLHRFYDLAS